MKRLNLFLLILFVVIFTTFATVFVIERNRIVQINNYPMDVNVIEEKIIGINVDPDGFHFGSLNRGVSARRELYIQSDKKVLVTIYKEGEMSKWVGHPNDFIVKAGEQENISLSVSIPRDAEYGNYTGEVTVVLRKV